MTTMTLLLLVLGILVGMSTCLLIITRDTLRQARRNMEILEELDRLLKQREWRQR